MTRKLALLALLMCSMAWAAPVAAAEKNAGTFISGLGNEVIGIVSKGEPGDADREARLEKVFYRAVDVDWIARFVLGKHIRKASEVQKKRYLAAYGPFAVNVYAKRFNEYSGETFKVTRTQKDPQGFFMVHVQIIRPAGEPVEVQFRVHERNGKLKIFDVVIEGVSQLTTQRSEFNTIVADGGLDALIARLEEKGGKKKVEKVAAAKE